MKLFLLDTIKTALKNGMEMENFNKRWTQSGSFFENLNNLYRFTKKSRGGFPYALSSTAPVGVAEYVAIFLDIPNYSWKCLNKLFWLCQGSAFVWSSNMFNRLSRMPQVLNFPLNMAQYVSIMPEYDHDWILLSVTEYVWINLFWLRQGSQFASSSYKFARVLKQVLNMPRIWICRGIVITIFLLL